MITPPIEDPAPYHFNSLYLSYANIIDHKIFACQSTNTVTDSKRQVWEMLNAFLFTNTDTKNEKKFRIKVCMTETKTTSENLSFIMKQIQ